MTATVETLLFMLAVLAAVAVVAKRLNIAPSILLVVAGIGVAFIPGLPKVELAPEVVLLVILPPLIYSAGVAMSWREFKFNRLSPWCNHFADRRRGTARDCAKAWIAAPDCRRPGGRRPRQ
jgi:NhaP-type Na+/H+ or K+/H+ antiporter